MKFLRVLMVMACLFLSQTAWAGWPEIRFPDQASVESVGSKVRLNGVPMQLYQLTVKQRVNDVELFFRAELGERHVTKRLENGVILSQSRGRYFISVKITPMHAGVTEALVSISDMEAAKQQANLPLGFKLPRGSNVLSDIESNDDDKYARQLVYVNRHAINANAMAITDMLKNKGYQLSPTQMSVEPHQKVLTFQGKRKEANAVIVYERGYSSIVLIMVENP